MNEQNTKKLYDDFPKLYRGRHRSMQESLMPFGFACHDGWFQIIYDLSKKITKADPKGEVEAVQVKEKFGGLRFYVYGATNKIHELIDKAEEKSFHICEICGKKGVLRDKLPWILTLCLKHYREYLPKTKLRKNIFKPRSFKIRVKV